MIILLGLIYLLVPIGIIAASENIKIINKIGAIIIAYALGLILGHIGLIPRPGDFLAGAINLGVEVNSSFLNKWLLEGNIVQSDILAYKIYKLQDILVSVMIPLSIPLLLYSLKIRLWFRMSGKTLLSMVLAMVVVVVFIVVGHLIFKDNLSNSNKIAGMLVGLYTGGTPNLASLKQILDIDTETYIMTHTYDTIVGVAYLFFLITIGKNLFRKFLKPYPRVENAEIYDHLSFDENAYQGFFKKKIQIGLLKIFGLTVAIVGISVAFGLLFESNFMLVVILTITTLSILSSLIPLVNNTKKSFELGMYFITVFSFVVASMADIRQLIDISSSLIGYITLVYFGSLICHALLCKIFRVDADTLMVTSTALLCSPPFVPMVAGSLKNKEVVVSGLTVGIIGYAIGNYLGAAIAHIL